MSEVQRLLIEENGEIHEIFVESKTDPTVATYNPGGSKRPGEMGVGEEAQVKMQQARSMIRAYAMYALSAFKDFGVAEVQEVTLKFGLKLNAKAGIPYITEGSAESNLEISVKCTFPKQK
jgi:hypothetical protein